MAAPLRSVANTWMRGGSGRVPACSISSIAMVYASSPVAQPGTHTRTSSSRPFSSKSTGKAPSSAANTLGSRKKLVTEISRSSKSAAASAALRRRWSR